MLFTLIKKQFFECFKSYFVNPKTNKRRSKKGIAGFFILFASIMIFLCITFFGISHTLGKALFAIDYAWLFYSIMGTLSVLLGVFGSVFNTFSMLYIAKDNDLLLSLPIEPYKILVSRLSLVYGLSMLYSSIVWLPSVVYGWVFGKATVISVIFDILLIPVLSLFVTFITALLGWLVAMISVRVKNKSFFTVAFSLIFFFAYYFFCFKMSDVFKLITANTERVGNGIKTWGNIIYQLGKAADGGVSQMIIFTLISVLLFAATFFCLSKSFAKIVTKSSKTKKAQRKSLVSRSQSVKKALLKRELKRFLSSPLYILNCGFGSFILPILSIIALFKRNMLYEALQKAAAELPILKDYISALILFVILMCISINIVSTPSVSLEGKNLWILRSLPLNGSAILESKLKLHIYLNTPSAILAVVLLAFCLKQSVLDTVLSAFIIILFIIASGASGLLIGLKNPDFNWINETTPIKQSLNVLISMLINWLIAVAICGCWYFLRDTVKLQYYFIICIALLLVGTFLLVRLLFTKGGKIFDKL